MSAIITKISDHGSDYEASNTYKHEGRDTPIRRKKLGCSMFTVVTGTGSKRKSTTVHGTRADAERVAGL